MAKKKKEDKRLYVLVIVLFILFVIIYGAIYRYNNLKYLDRLTFETEVFEVFNNAKFLHQTNHDIKSFGQIDGLKCDQNINVEYPLANINYYFEFGENDTIIKMYVSSDRWKYINDEIIIIEKINVLDNKETITNVKDFKFDCEGNILSR